ncbi:MAG: 2-C-methyl-D-erythritol 4-phosphate cytidylyltransferase [Bacteroides sp.]|nr:2-C-methyl-D-erythritol 4-phosphate cytidylyltransferase [Alistipes timonensis]MCM1310980.1 2-C-methyl-D-erythritol 4-phosphate cytidylyltransferase [Bacteroides sp.]MCM1405147.1 2-C-methyl-D-erythritol 4-phosphate cytidylyltransferase [[Clostridium] fimetarium]
MNIGILLSGGTGQRLGAKIPKQYIEVNGQPIIGYSLGALAHHSRIDGLVIVAAEVWRDDILSIVNAQGILKPVVFAEPGETRQFSIYNGLKVIERTFGNDVDLVLIHDAARPLVSKELLDSCLCLESDYDAALPVLGVKDTIYQSDNNRSITGLLDRSTLYAGQAPESFRFRKYLDAHNDMSVDELMKINGSSEVAFMRGLVIRLVKGDPMNFKITDSQDLANFKRVLG